MTDRNHSQGMFGRMGAAWRRFRRDRRANVAVIFALALVPTLGVFGLGSEGSYWLLTQRAEQNAADAAVLAAAQAGQADTALTASSGTPCSGGSNCYKYEGNAVATNYGFTQGANGVTAVNVQQNQPCPADVSGTVTGALGTNICYKVTITKLVPLYFVSAVGYRGTSGQTLNGGPAQQIQAIAWAGPRDEPISVCVLALGPDAGGKSAIRLNGGKSSNLGDCTIFSDDTATCNGHNSGAFIGGAVGTDNNCGIAAYSNAATVADPYAALASNIPANNCTKYQQETAATKNTAAIPAAAIIPTGIYSASSLVSAINSAAGSGLAYTSTDASGDSVVEVCGDVQLGGNVTVSSGNVILVVENGLVDMNGGNSLATSGTGGMTTIFQNQANGTPSPTPVFTDVSNGTSSAIDISSPTAAQGNTGPWAGVTIYDPALTGDYLFAGNAPAWSLSGIVYFPNANIDWRGIIGKATNGFQCFDLTVKTLLIDGTAQMFNPSLANPTAGCHDQGSNLPFTNIGYRYVLVA
jgi:Flp pilus assembly protein TadG